MFLGRNVSPAGTAATVASADRGRGPVDEMVSQEISSLNNFMFWMLQHFLRAYNESRIRLKKPPSYS
jgi:hypothetical protein